MSRLPSRRPSSMPLDAFWRKLAHYPVEQTGCTQVFNVRDGIMHRISDDIPVKSI